MHSKQRHRIVGVPFNRPTTHQQQRCHLNTNLKLCNKPETKGDLPEEMQQYLEESTKWEGSGPQTVRNWMTLNYKPIANAGQCRTAQHGIGLLVTITIRQRFVADVPHCRQTTDALIIAASWAMGEGPKIQMKRN